MHDDTDAVFFLKVCWGVRYAGTFQRWFHPGHLRPRHHHRPAGGGEEDGWGAGAEGAVRKISGAGMWRYPLQSLTQIQGTAVWVRYGSPGKSGEKEEQAGHRALPVPGCGSAGEFWRIRRRVALTGNSLLLKVVQILPRTKRKIPANPQGVCWNSLEGVDTLDAPYKLFIPALPQNFFFQIA